MERESKKPTKRQLATLERRRHIVEIAATCFVEQGFHQTSIRDIAERAQISLGNLYNHFKSKTELIAEIASLEADDMVQIRLLLEGTGSDLERICTFASAYYDYVSRPEIAVLTAEITAEAMRSPQIVDAFLHNRQLTVDGVINLLDSTDFSFSEEAVELAQVLLNLVESTASRVAFKTAKDKAATRTMLLSVIRRLLA